MRWGRCLLPTVCAYCGAQCLGWCRLRQWIDKPAVRKFQRTSCPAIWHKSPWRSFRHPPGDPTRFGTDFHGYSLLIDALSTPCPQIAAGGGLCEYEIYGSSSWNYGSLPQPYIVVVVARFFAHVFVRSCAQTRKHLWPTNPRGCSMSGITMCLRRFLC